MKFSEPTIESVRQIALDRKKVPACADSMKCLHFGNASGEPLVILPGLSLKSVMNLKDLIVSE